VLTSKIELRVLGHTPFLARHRYYVNPDWGEEGERRFYPIPDGLLPVKLPVSWSGDKYKAYLKRDDSKPYYSFAVSSSYEATPAVPLDSEELIDLEKEGDLSSR